MKLIKHDNLIKLVAKAKYFTIRKSIVQEALERNIDTFLQGCVMQMLESIHDTIEEEFYSLTSFSS
jgi:hypothetical protein